MKLLTMDQLRQPWGIYGPVKVLIVLLILVFVWPCIVLRAWWDGLLDDRD
jgi:hypothetical protein